MWHNRLKTLCCHLLGLGSIPGLGTFTRRQKKPKNKNKLREREREKEREREREREERSKKKENEKEGAPIPEFWSQSYGVTDQDSEAGAISSNTSSQGFCSSEVTEDRKGSGDMGSGDSRF